MDEQLYSRQLYVLGKEAQVRLEQSNVLLVGRLGGLGAEIAKNLMLAGVCSLTVVDDGPVTVGDLASNFFAREEDVTNRTSRSQVLLRELGELNAHVRLNHRTESELTLDDEGIGRYSVVVLVDEEKARIEEIDAFCRSHSPNPIQVCCAGAFGLYGYVFNDFGPQHTVLDSDGEALKYGIIVDAKDQGDRLLLLTSDDKHHGLKEGDWVSFKGLGGLESLCDGTPRQIKLEKITNSEGNLIDGFAFSVSIDGSAQGKYGGGGHFQQVKVPIQVPFRSFVESLEQPVCTVNDWIDVDMPQKLHALLRGLWEFKARQNGQLPAPGNMTHAGQVLALAEQFYIVDGESSVWKETDRKKMLRLAAVSSGQLNPLAAYIGGIAAQEVLKACSGKFSPIQEWFHFAAVEALASDAPQVGELPTLEQLGGHQLWAANARYAGQAAVFGWKFQERLGNLKVFLVGAGALGCETLKNLAMMGVACGDNGQLTVTDMDGIELSNLNRQFLFRPQHIGKMKSVVAAEMSKAMNPGLKVKALEVKVAPDTESTFNDAFWASQDVVVNALDNVIARQYVDSKCVFYQKPLLESGTLGTKANTLPVIPFLTESYSSDPVKDDGSDEIPACTLHAYPNLIEHTLTWARDAVFEKYFYMEPMEGQEYLRHLREGTLDSKYKTELDRQPSTKLNRLRTARQVLVELKPNDHPEKLFPYHVGLNNVDLKTCVTLARMRFEELFVNKIKQLLHVHPLDKTVDDVGTKFWSGKRRAPHVEWFDATDSLHLLFVVSATLLYGKIYRVQDAAFESMDSLQSSVKSILAALDTLPEFHVDGSVRVPENDEEAKKLQKEQEEQAKKDAESAEQASEAELEELGQINLDTAPELCPQAFEKDDDSNGHFDLIFAAACIRARSYDIPLVDRLEAKRIVGRIIPAIATTTATTTGAVALELYKVVHGHPLELFRSSNLNLAVNSFASFEPNPCKVQVFGKKRYIKAGEKDKTMNVSLWTMVDLRGDKTVQDIIDYFADRFEFEVTSIGTKGDVSLYNDMFNQDDRLDQSISELYRSVTNSEPPSFIILNVDGDFDDEQDEDEDEDEDEDDEDEDLPIPACRLAWCQSI